MRRLLGVVAVTLLTLVAAPAAFADSTGQIDHLEVAPDGSVKMLYSVPGLARGTAPDLDSVRVEVGGKAVAASASPVEAGEVERTSVLALDVSDSMRGDRFEAAKQAALTYLDEAPADVAIGLVTFAGSVTVVEAPTTDRDRLESSVEALELSSGTKLYDGVLEAIAQLSHDGQRQVVVLSDGADTGSTPLGEVVSTAKKSGVTVIAVALEQSAANEAKLRSITDATNGTVVPADDPRALAAVFAHEAEALAQQVLIEFKPSQAGETTVSASLDADGQTYTDSTFVSLEGEAPEPETKAPGPIPVESPATVVDERFLFGGVAAIGLGLAVFVALLLIGKPQDRGSHVQRQLDFYSNGSGSGSGSGAVVSTSDVPRRQLDVRESAVTMAENIVAKGGLEERITQRLTAAGLALTAAEWLLLHAGVVVASALVGLLLSGGNALVVLLCVLFGSVGPWLFLSIKESRRLKAFNSQLADTLQLMSGGLSAGLSLPQSVDTVVREGAEPMAGELRRALVEQRLGVDIEDALDGVADRMQSKDFRWVVMAIRIQREIGGNLAELLNTVAATIREREYLRRQVRTLSAEGRLSAWILGGLPIAFTLYLIVTKPGYLEPMYTTTIGWVLSFAGVGLLGMGSLWLKSVVKVEV